MSANVFDLQGSISMDTSGFDKAIKDAVAEGEKLVQALSENTAQMKSMQDSVEKARAEIENAAKAMKETSDAADDMAKETKRSADAVGDTAKEVEGLKAEVDKANKSVEDLADETHNLGTRMDKAESDIDGLQQQVDKLGKEYDENEKETRELDTETKKLGETAESTGGKLAALGDFLKTGLGVAVTAGVGAIAAAGTAIVGYTKSAFDAYSSYEQLQGGVNTLFGDSSTAVMENAEKAAKSAGMSINNYLDTVMGFSSSLIQSTGRGEQVDLDELKKTLDEKYETQKKAWDKEINLASSAEKDLLREQRDADLKRLKEANKAALEQAEVSNMTSVTTEESLARAAELADVAIKDMSDNANKFGTDMGSLQNAYQGFAKQNYTMLDNLKLGYDGTKEEMERLLDDAERLTGQEYDLSSYADIVEAIHAIQESMQIAGTTKDEAEGTLEGSAKAMAAEWENLKLAIAGGDIENIEKHINSLVAGSEQFIRNSVPVIERILEGIGVAIPRVAEVIGKEVPKLVGDLLPPLVKAATSLISGLVGALPGLLKEITNPSTVNTILVALQYMLSAIVDGLGSIIESAPDIIPDLLNQVGNALINSVDILGNAIMNILPDIGRLLTKSAPVLFGVISGLVSAIAEFITTLVPDLLPQLVELGSDLIQELMDSDLISTVALLAPELLNALLEGILASQEIALDVIPEIIDSIFSMLQTHIDEHGAEFTLLVLDIVKNLFFVIINTFFATFVELGEVLWGSLKGLGGLITTAAEWLDEKTGGILTSIFDFFEGIGEKFYDFKDKALEKVGTLVGDIVSKIAELPAKAIDIGKDLVTGLWEGISGAATWLGDRISGFADGVVGGFKNAFDINSPSKVMETLVGKNLALGIGEGFMNTMGDITDDMTNALQLGVNELSTDVSVESAGGATAASGGGVYIYNTFSLEGVKIASDVDIEEMSDKAIQMISEKLGQLRIFDTRAYGGVVLP